jgi:amidase
MAFNTLTTTASQLRHLLEKNEITSVSIVETYLSMIECHNKAGLRLNALISVAPRDVVLEKARLLDEERQAGNVRSPLHGIPIILKDAIVTDASLGMPTSAGSRAFLNSKTKRNAALVDTLLEAGLIIIGKANMTEFCGMVSTKMNPGYSSVAGQTLSAYVRGGIEKNETILGHSAPGGSSTGSAVAVSAGFAPLAIGTETVGSIVTPSVRAALYAMKLTHGITSCEGIFRICETYDAPGPMAKCTEDLQLLVDVMLKNSRIDSVQLKKEESTPIGLKVGFADPRIWAMDEESCRPVEGALDQMVSKPCESLRSGAG